MPKSPILASLSLERKMFCGLMSLCMMFHLWICPKARASWQNQSSIYYFDNAAFFFFLASLIFIYRSPFWAYSVTIHNYFFLSTNDSWYFIMFGWFKVLSILISLFKTLCVSSCDESSLLWLSGLEASLLATSNENFLPPLCRFEVFPGLRSVKLLPISDYLDYYGI